MKIDDYLRHWDLHQVGHSHLADEEANCHWCQILSFSNNEFYPIKLMYGEDDDHRLPKNFHFIEHNILRDGAELTTNDFHAGCGCSSSDGCKRVTCSCLSDVAFPQDGGLSKKLIVYHTKGPLKETLRSEVLDSRQPIYECHSKCSCGMDCPNRVVERGRKVPLQIFMTSDGRGWGVRAERDIKVGQFVDTYVGEVITAKEANIRRNKSEIAQRKDVYLFALDKFHDPKNWDERLSGPPLEVDGEFASGPTRFINHSCDPNLRIFAVVGDHSNTHLHDLAFFAIEEIPAGTELTFDYVDGLEEGSIDDSKDSQKKKDMTRCLCGSTNCRGYLW